MLIYFLLIFFILLLPIFLSGIVNQQKKNQIILVFSLFAIFMVMALKAPSVGRDIEGYKKIYEMMCFYSWANFDVSWMEWGYELLMMIFTHIFHASFQTFTICIYGFVYYSYFQFFKKYSQDYTTSILLYICFTFFTFDASALRNMLGLAICLYAVPFAEQKGIMPFFKFVFITFIAAQIHKSAYIFLGAYFIIKIPFSVKSFLVYLLTPCLLLLCRSSLYSFINLHLKHVEENNLVIGGNLIVYSLGLLFAMIVWFLCDSSFNKNNNISDGYSIVTSNISNSVLVYFTTNGLAMRMVYVGIVLQLFGSGTVLTRMAQYMQFFILILLANNIARFTKQFRLIIKIILYSLAVIYFWYFSLLANALDIVPYRLCVGGLF